MKRLYASTSEHDRAIARYYGDKCVVATNHKPTKGTIYMLSNHNEVLGAGAREYLQQYFRRSMSREDVQLVVSEIKAIATDDKRVKRCEHCGGYWRDDSLRNTKKTCSDECKTGIKTLQRRKQRERKGLLGPPKPTKHKLTDDYIDWLEYPYWTNEYSMLKVGWKHDVPHTNKTLSHIEAHRAVWREGNRKVKVAKGAE
jgi:hypothetical protein